MTLLPAAADDRAGRWTSRRWSLALLLLVLATVAIRARYFGNPFVDVDEQFYLLTGGRLLQGALPYVDIWDRKPVGLFLLYAAIRLLGGDGVLHYQLIACGFVAATAVMIAIMARRIATPGAALIAGLAYVPALAMSGGQGGQTPVFYNLLVAIAAWLLVRLAADDAPRAPRIVRDGAVAMLLVGCALQIKYSAVFEGVYFGLALLWFGRRMRPVALAGAALLWVGLALLPTMLALAWYVAAGHGDAFVYANFTSIIARGPVVSGNEWHDFTRLALRMLIFAVPILAAAMLRRHLPRPSSGSSFLIGWALAAIAGVLIFGTFFNHYALPLLPPLAVLAARGFAIRWRHAGAILTGAVLLALFIPYRIDVAKREGRHGAAAYARQLTALIAPRLHGRCLFVFYGEPLLYDLTNSCLPTRFAFPFHLTLAREAAAMGVDPIAETNRIMDMRPPIVVDRLTDDDEVNHAVQTLVRRRLARDYHLIWRYRHPVGVNTDMVWEIGGRQGTPDPAISARPAPAAG